MNGFEGFYIGGLMEGPDARHAETIGIDAADGFTEGQHAIHQVQMKPEYLSGARIGPVMAVMEQGQELVARLEGQNAVDHEGIVPLV